MYFDLSEDDFKNYDNFISLGYFCEVAKDLEKMGLRNTSSPFDWCISDFHRIIQLINDKFYGFMDYENMAQSQRNRNIYMDQKNSIFFFHDFTKYKPFDDQYSSVREKYERRISRFLQNIKSPTLFVRYISNEIRDNEDKSVELQWIEDNVKFITDTIKEYNENNNIVFISNEGVKSDIIKIYQVKPEKNDTVSRNPIRNNKELFPIINNYHIAGQEHNIEIYELKEKRKNQVGNIIKRKTIAAWHKIFGKVYIHTKEYNIPNK